MATVDVHYGHLCTIRVTKFDVIDTFNGARAASIVFQVQANKTRAYRTYPIRVSFDGSSTPIMTVRAAWKQLTGQDITLEAGSVQTVAAPTAGQQATMEEIKEFVRTETQKLGVNLTLDVI